jgi:hypothetical protein
VERRFASQMILEDMEHSAELPYIGSDLVSNEMS